MSDTNPDGEESPLWRDLLLPNGVFRAGVGQAPKIREVLEGPPEISELGSMLPRPANRDYWLNKIAKTGQLPILGPWERIGRPQHVIITTSIRQPGVALVGLFGEQARSPENSATEVYHDVRKVSTASDRAAMVFLDESALSRLALERGQQVLMTTHAGVIILANPGWHPLWEFWDNLIAQTIYAQEVQRGQEWNGVDF